MRNLYDFDDCLSASKTDLAKATDIATIKAQLSGCIDVRPALNEDDKAGIDYIATIEGGREVFIDLKTRTPGCSRFWRSKNKSGEPIPELAIETWSVCPNSRQPNGQVGWTFDRLKKTDLILYRFSQEDFGRAFMLPFHTLRMAAESKLEDWMAACKVDRQQNHSYLSESIFVRADWVLDAMRMAMCGRSAPERVFYIQQLLFDVR
jgi:hypothetical protein